jgi:hypothetical protein
MKIKADDPWYPTCVLDCEPGVTIRLKLVADMTNAIVGTYRQPTDGSPMQVPGPHTIIEWAEELTDTIIERANRDEGKPG